MLIQTNDFDNQTFFLIKISCFKYILLVLIVVYKVFFFKYFCSIFRNYIVVIFKSFSLNHFYAIIQNIFLIKTKLYLILQAHQILSKLFLLGHFSLFCSFFLS